MSNSALSTISRLPLSSANYKEATNILQQLYGNTQVLVSAHLRKFVQLPKIKSSSDVKELQNRYDQIVIIVWNLKSLEIDITKYGSLLALLPNEKLTSELHNILSRKFENDKWGLDDMLKCLKTEVVPKERSMFIGTSSESEKEIKTENIQLLHF